MSRVTAHFATYCDTHYAAKAIAMIQSLCRWAPSAGITALAMDDTAAKMLTDRFGRRVHVMKQCDLEASEPRLTSLRSQRTAWEFYATQKPILLRTLLARQPAGGLLAYIDADTFFFADPSSVLREMDGHSIALSPHRFHPGAEHLSIYGPFNAGFCIWRNDPAGRRCIEDWSEDCLDWCRCEVDDAGRFMNQGYLERWPERYPGVRVLAHPGANLAPWNLSSHSISSSRWRMLVDGKPLVFFHFSALSRGTDGIWETYALAPELERQDIIDKIFRPYLLAVDAASRRLAKRWGLSGDDAAERHGPSTDRVVIGKVERRGWLRGWWLRPAFRQPATSDIPADFSR